MSIREAGKTNQRQPRHKGELEKSDSNPAPTRLRGAGKPNQRQPAPSLLEEAGTPNQRQPLANAKPPPRCKTGGSVPGKTAQRHAGSPMIPPAVDATVMKGQPRRPCRSRLRPRGHECKMCQDELTTTGPFHPSRPLLNVGLPRGRHPPPPKAAGSPPHNLWRAHCARVLVHPPPVPRQYFTPPPAIPWDPPLNKA